MNIRMAHWDGTNPPKYIQIEIKKSAVQQHFENLFYYHKLKTIIVYEDEKVSHAITIPDNFIELHLEEGDLIVSFGDILYYDDAW